MAERIFMNKSGIEKPTVFNGEGSDPIQLSILFTKWEEQLSTWAEGYHVEPFLTVGEEGYMEKYPFVFKERKPILRDLDRLINPLGGKDNKDNKGGKKLKGDKDDKLTEREHPEADYVYTSREKIKMIDKFDDEMEEYNFKRNLKRDEYAQDLLSKARELYAVMQSSTKGTANKLVLAMSDKEVFERSALALRSLKARYQHLQVGRLPELEDRFSVKMGSHEDPEVFIINKLKLRGMIEHLDEGRKIKDKEFIYRLLAWLPANYSKEKDIIESLIDHAHGEIQEERDIIDLTGNDNVDSTDITLTRIRTRLEAYYHTLKRSKGTSSTDREVNREKGGLLPAFVSRGVSCFGCGKAGHIRKECRVGTNKCYKCGDEGHRAFECTKDQGATSESKTRGVKAFPATTGGMRGGRKVSYTGICNICEGSGHSYDKCPVVLNAREQMTGKDKPITPLVKSSANAKGKVSFMIRDLERIQQLYLTGSDEVQLSDGDLGGVGPSFDKEGRFIPFMDDNGASICLVRSADLLAPGSVIALKGSIRGVGKAVVTHIGSVIINGLCLEGDTMRLRITTAYVVEGLDRNIIGTSKMQRHPLFDFKRKRDPHVIVYEDETETTIQGRFRLDMYGPNEFHWFGGEPVSSFDLDLDDRQWIGEAFTTNLAIAGETEEEPVSHVGLHSNSKVLHGSKKEK